MKRLGERRYGPTIFASIAALTPYLLWEGSAALVETSVAGDLGTSRFWFGLFSTLSTAAYAFGALMGGDLVRRFHQRRLFLSVQIAATIGWVLMTAAPSIALYALGQFLIALSGGVLLVVALPPALRSFGASSLPLTVFFVNFGLFGAVAAGPLIGGILAASEAWRVFTGLMAGLSCLVLVAAMIYLPGGEPKEPDRRLDAAAIILAFLGTGLPFLAVALIPASGLGSVAVLGPLIVGLAAFAGLLVYQYRTREPLAPVGPILSTLPAIGTIVATLGGGMFVTSVAIVTRFQTQFEGMSALSAGLGFWPQLAGLAAAAVLLALALPSRAYLPVMGLGLATLFGSTALFILFGPASGLAGAVALFLVGFGAGSTVAAGLVLAGLSLPVTLLAGVISLVELSRAIGNFLPSPILIKTALLAEGATTIGPASAQLAFVFLLVILTLGVGVVVLLLAAGGRLLPKADLDAWLADGSPAFTSPQLFARWRRTE